MKIRLQIEYHTEWGQRLCVAGSIPELGAWNLEKAAAMSYVPSGVWVLDLDLPARQAKEFTYKYFILHEHHDAQEWEWGPDRRFAVPAERFTEIELHDVWRPHGDIEQALYTSAFRRVILRPPAAVPRPPAAPNRRGCVHRFRVPAPRAASGEQLCIVGDDPALGNWDERKAVPMTRGDDPLWEADVMLKQSHAVVQYKYGLYDAKAGRIVAWEPGPNRTRLIERRDRKKRLTVFTDHKFQHPGSLWRGAGVNFPVFSLRSRHGLGVGEFPDIKLLVDWAAKAGLKMIQLLPVNDTIATHTWVDSYPYAAISVFALHPIYMNLEAMGVPEYQVPMDQVRERREELNASDTVDYEAVMAVKSWYFKQAYDAQRDEFLSDPGFLAFFDANREWLIPYAAFSCLRDRFGTSDHTLWPESRRISREDLDAFVAPDQPHYDDVAVHYFIQFHLHRQLLDAAQYARSKRIILKGDIPIGVYRHSVDTWVYPDLFHMDVQAGAPPDDFAIDGQNWGFPTYNWEEMAKDGYAWWQARFKKMSAYFDAFRIDHILGFFRIWEIPGEHVQGIMGRFNPALPLSRSELAARGVWLDYERMSEPHIRWHMLGGRFGEYTDEVIRDCLDEFWPGCYRLKPELRTQRQVAERFATPPDGPPEVKRRNDTIRGGLLGLLSEVVFLEAPGSHGQEFNPRNSLHRTVSYQELGDETKQRINEIYIDYFYKRHEQFWRDQAMVKLPAIKNATDMLICGEDLGMVPDCVPGVLDEMGILSLFVERMPKNPKQEFYHPADCPYLSVCTPSTHDMSTLRGWWEEDRGKIQRFFNIMMGQWGGAPYFCEPWVVHDIVVQHLYAPSMWAVFMLQDLLGMSERLRRENPREEKINEPSNPHHYWRYRLHLHLEDLIADDEFNGMLRGLIDASGRNRG